MVTGVISKCFNGISGSYSPAHMLSSEAAPLGGCDGASVQNLVSSSLGIVFRDLSLVIIL